MHYALISLVLLAFIYARWLEPRWPRVSKIDIPIPGLEPSLDGFTILHLSDLHQAQFGPGQRRLLAAIDKWDYDLVALTGDFISCSAHYDFAPIAELLAGLKSPVYAVFGNHDYPRAQTMTTDLTARGVNILNNSWQTAEETNLQIAGIVDPDWTRHNPGSPYRADLSLALAGSDPAKFTLLLSHSPGIFTAATAAGIPLVLCGHTHGGQIKIPLLGAPTTASGKFFDPFVQGIYREGDTLLYINRGLGTSGLPLRFLSPPEVAFIRLVRV